MAAIAGATREPAKIDTSLAGKTPRRSSAAAGAGPAGAPRPLRADAKPAGPGGAARPISRRKLGTNFFRSCGLRLRRV